MSIDYLTLAKTVRAAGVDSPAELEELCRQILVDRPTGGTWPPSGGGGSNKDASGDPTSVTPDYVGQYYRDTATGNIWKANSTTPGDWTLVVQDMGVRWEPTNLSLKEALGFFTYGPLNGSYSKISFLQASSLPGFDIATSNCLFDFPNLTNIDAGHSQRGSFSSTAGNGLTFNASILTSIDKDLSIYFSSDLVLNFPALVSINGSIYGDSCSNISVILPDLIMVVGDIDFHGSTFAVLNISSLIPTDGKILNFGGCNLTSVMVQQILRRCVLAGVTTCIIDLSGGTNAGTSSLNAQGQSDVTTLGAQLFINP